VIEARDRATDLCIATFDVALCRTLESWRRAQNLLSHCETWVSLQTTSGVVAGKRPRSAHAEANIDKRVDYFEIFKEAFSKMVQVSSDAAVKLEWRTS